MGQLIPVCQRFPEQLDYHQVSSEAVDDAPKRLMNTGFRVPSIPFRSIGRLRSIFNAVTHPCTPMSVLSDWMSGFCSPSTLAHRQEPVPLPAK